jgi:hypothetical protein
MSIMGSLQNDLEKAEAKIVRLRAALAGMLQEWDQLTRYPTMAKSSNERVAAARAVMDECL